MHDAHRASRGPHHDSISRFCAARPRRSASWAPPTAFRLFAPNTPSGPRNRYSTWWRSRLRSNGSDAMLVVTVASSRPVEPQHRAPRRLPLQDLDLDPARRPP